jgi:hypothetical protein
MPVRVCESFSAGTVGCGHRGLQSLKTVVRARGGRGAIELFTMSLRVSAVIDFARGRSPL